MFSKQPSQTCQKTLYVQYNISADSSSLVATCVQFCVFVCVQQVEEVEVMVADTSGENVDNKTRLELLKKREKLIQEEEEEKLKEVR